MKKILGVILWLFFSSLTALVQSPPDTPLPHYRELNLPGMREKAGLLHQDASSWLYLLNNKQLQRFDGAVWKTYQLPADTFEFTALTSYQGQVWAGTKTGQLLQSKGDSLLPFEPEEGWPRKSITALAVYRGWLWMATAGEGVYAFNGKRLFLFDLEDGLPDLVVSSLEVDKNGILAGTDLGLVRLSIHSKNQKSVRLLSNEPLLSAVKSDGNALWLGLQSGGLALFQNGQLSRFAHADEDAVMRLLVLEEEVWFSDRAGHLWRFHKKTKQYSALPFTHNGKAIRVYDMWQSREGLVWISTQHGLLQAFPGVSTHLLPHPHDVQAIRILPNQQLLAGTNAGCYVKSADGNNWQLLPQTQQLHVLSLAAESDNSWLAGTFGQGLYRLQWGRVPQRIGPNEHRFNPNIFSIEPQPHGAGWYLGTLGGLYEYRRKSGADVVEPFHQQHGPGQYYIFQLTHDRQGHLWMATDGKGVFRFADGQFRQFNQLAQGPLRVASSLSADSSNRLWGSSPEQGLFVVENQQMRLVPLALSEPISFVHSLNRHQLLLGLQQGLLLYNSTQNTALPLERLLALPLTQISTNAYLADEKGIWIGMRGRLLHLNSHWLQHIALPRILLSEAFSIKQNSETPGAVFAAFDNNLRFDFSIPWFFDTDLLYVRYKLHGLHERWVETDKREIMLQGLNAGTYELEIQVSFDPAFKQYQSVKRSFRIQKPFYSQWWFVLLLAILLLLGAAWVVQSREEKRRLRQEAEKQSILAQYELLKNQISPHFLFNAFNTLSALIDLDTQKAGAYVEQLAVLFRKILHYQNHDTIRLAEEMELVRAYVFLQQQRFENRLHVSIELDDTALQQWVIPMSIQLLVENAVKHNVISQTKPLYIRIYTVHQHVVVSNKLQPKASPEPSSGFGLSSLSSRYQQLFGSQIGIEQTNEHFMVSLPLIETRL